MTDPRENAASDGRRRVVRHFRSTRLDLPVLLPDAPDAKDACIARLVDMLASREGVRRVHVMEGVATAGRSLDQLCLHYDAERLTLDQLTALAHASGAELTSRFGHSVLAFRSVGSEDDALRIEDGLRALAGVTAASVNAAAQVARVEYDRAVVGEGDVAAALERLTTAPPLPVVPEATLPVEGAPATPRPSWYARNRELAWSLTAGVLLLAGWLAAQGGAPRPATIAVYVLSYLFGARDNVGHFVGNLRRGRLRFDIDLLMVVAAIGAAILGEWAEGALLLFLFSLGHSLEHYALGRARHAIAALAELAPSRAIRLRSVGERRIEEVVPIADVRPGDLVLVKPGERLPVDGTVAEGRSAVNQAPITGESVPVLKEAGAGVYAGSVNGDGALVVTVTTALGDRTLDRVIQLVAEAQTQKAPTQQFTERFERVFVPLVLLATVAISIAPPLLGIWPWEQAFYRAMTLLVAASPCALALGTPAAVLAGIAQAARHGVLIKGGAYLEELGAIDTVALDKTGTITEGKPRVTEIVPADGMSEEVVLQAAVSVERQSQHPLARAVLEAGAARGISGEDATEAEAVTGRGIRARVRSAMVEVGHLSMFTASPGGVLPNDAVPDAITQAVARLEGAGRSTMVVRRVDADGTAAFLGVLGVADTPRPGIVKTLGALRDTGVRHLVMLTGDNNGVARAVAAEVGIDDVRAALLPEGKVEAIRALAATGRVAMVGDGVNDAPALAHATVGIAMGGAGTAAALETADVALMSDDIGRLPFAMALSRASRRVIKQNLVVSLGVMLYLVAASVSGRVGIGLAVIFHEASTLVVIANALRLLRHGGDGRGARVPGALVVAALVVLTACGSAEIGYRGREARDWIRQLDDSSATRRMEAGDALGRILVYTPNDARVLNALVRAMADTDDFVRVAAADALSNGGVQSSAAMPSLQRALGDSAHAFVRRRAVDLIGRLGRASTDRTPEAAKLRIAAILATTLTDPNVDVRAAAADALGLMGPTARRQAEVVPALALAATDTAPAVRRLALQAFDRIRAPSDVALPLFVRALADPEPRTRLVAVEGIGKVEGDATAAIAPLLRLLEDDERVVRLAVVVTLGTIGASDPRVADALQEATSDEDSVIAQEATHAMTRFHDRGGVDPAPAEPTRLEKCFRAAPGTAGC